MPPQKSEILLASPTLRSDSHTASSTHALRNSSLQTSSSTHPSTSCLNCENKALCTAIFFCCSYRTVSSFFPIHIFVAFFVPPETSSLCGGTRRNSMDTFQRFKNNSFADCNYSISFECIYCRVYMSKWNDKIACDFRLVFINIFFLL